MLPEADFVFLDELLNANSAILNSLLLVLNERVFRRGRETRPLPTLMVVGASNRLPEDDALGALFDRFLLRVRCDNVPPEQLSHVLVAGWQLDMLPGPPSVTVKVDDVRRLHEMLRNVDFAHVRDSYVELVHRLRHAGIMVSDRRAVKLQRMLAASALLCGRLEVNRTDMWVLRYIWDTEEQQDVLASIVDDVLEKADAEEQQVGHPRSRSSQTPNPEDLARDLERIAARFEDGDVPAKERAYLQDQLGLLAARCQWVENEQQRAFLESKLDVLWGHVGGRP
jgi:MoxR-like ATPase